jgi:hypothetical protein
MDGSFGVVPKRISFADEKGIGNCKENERDIGLIKQMSKELLDCPYLLDHLEHPHYLALCNPEAMCRKASSDAVQLTLLRGLARFKLFLGAFLILSGFAHQMMVVMVMV